MLCLALCSIFLTAPSNSQEDDDWTSQQQEIIGFLRACINQTEMEAWLDCYHQDYRGWYRTRQIPFSFVDKKTLAMTWEWGTSDGDGESSTSEYLSIETYGKTAIVLSIDSYPADSYYPGSPALKERWTAVLVAQDGNWKIVSEHADEISGE